MRLQQRTSFFIMALKAHRTLSSNHLREIKSNLPTNSSLQNYPTHTKASKHAYCPVLTLDHDGTAPYHPRVARHPRPQLRHPHDPRTCLPQPPQSDGPHDGNRYTARRCG
jgi:hypothetical protein